MCTPDKDDRDKRESDDLRRRLNRLLGDDFQPFARLRLAMCDGSSGNGSGPSGLNRDRPGYDPDADTTDFLLDGRTGQQSTVERQNRGGVLGRLLGI